MFFLVCDHRSQEALAELIPTSLPGRWRFHLFTPVEASVILLHMAAVLHKPDNSPAALSLC